MAWVPLIECPKALGGVFVATAADEEASSRASADPLATFENSSRKLRRLTGVASFLGETGFFVGEIPPKSFLRNF